MAKKHHYLLISVGVICSIFVWIVYFAYIDIGTGICSSLHGVDIPSRYPPIERPVEFWECELFWRGIELFLLAPILASVGLVTGLYVFACRKDFTKINVVISVMGSVLGLLFLAICLFSAVNAVFFGIGVP